jgi:hypothetical protein
VPSALPAISSRSIVVAALAACAVASGCFSDRGLAIEIDVGDTGADRVELYIGQQHCDDAEAPPIGCRTITPPEALGPLAGEIWFRDDPLPYTADVKNGIATFQLRPKDAGVSDHVPILIAVGLAPRVPGPLVVGTATLRDVEVPAHRARIVTAALVPAASVVKADPKNGTEDRVQVWTKTTPASSCVVVEHWKSGAVTRDFVVPFEDPDCDDVPKLECNPSAYHGESPPGASLRPDCLASGGDGTCVLASRGCTDDHGPNSGSCTPQRDRVCVPELFCSACPGFDAACIATKIDDGAAMIPRVTCDVPARRVLPGLELCPGMASATIELGPLVGDADCDEPVLASLQLAGIGTSHNFGGAILELDAPKPRCTLPVTWRSGTRTSPDEQQDHGLLKVHFASGALLLPLVLNFQVGMCLTTDVFTCTVDGAPDTLWSCAQ